MQVFVTGCDGFVGHAACAAFHAAGHSVTGMDARLHGSSAWKKHEFRLESSELLSVLDAAQSDVLIHCAGTASVSQSFLDPAADFRGSVLLMQAVLDAASKAKKRPLVLYPSSAAVYGNPQSLPVPESAPTAPLSPYGVHKVMCEQLALAYQLAAGLPSIGLRVFSLLGPRQKRLLVYELASQVLAGNQELLLQGTGAEGRDYLFIDDLASTFVALAAQPRVPFAQWLNVASGSMTTVAELGQRVADAAGVRVTVRPLGTPQTGNPVAWQADISKLRERLPGFRPTSLDVALRKCLDAWREGPEPDTR